MIVLALDCESTGLMEGRLLKHDRQPHVIQFAATLVNLDTGERIHEYDTFVQPPGKELLSDKVSKITGIVWDDLKNAPFFFDVADRILPLIELSPMAVAHNLSFDRDVLDTEARRLGRSIKWPKMFCTAEATVHLKGFRLDLASLHEHLVGMDLIGGHRADADVAALVRCLIAMRKKDLI